MPYDLGDNTLSLHAQLYPPPYKRARAAFAYKDTARRLIIRMKFGDHPEIAPYLARFMVRAATELIADSDIIIPVPLHRLRIFMRRFNQSAELCRAISSATKMPIGFGILKRQHWTRQQVGLNRRHRRRNLRNAFIIPHNQSDKIKNKRILLVDDVLTTGTTVEICTKILLRAGARHVNILTAARVNMPEMLPRVAVSPKTQTRKTKTYI